MAKPNTRDLVVTRTFDVPVQLVWKAWTDAQHVMRWWGPDGFTAPTCKMDFRVGGRTLVSMQAPQWGFGEAFSVWEYTRIVPMERIEFVQNPADKDGNTLEPAQAGLPPDFPVDVRTVVTFKDLGSKTEMTITEYGLPDASSELGKNAELGLNQTIDKLGKSLGK